MKVLARLIFIVILIIISCTVSESVFSAVPLKLMINEVRINSPALNETYKDFLVDEINDAFFYEEITVITPKDDEKKVSPFQLLEKYFAGYLIDGSITKIGENFSIDFKLFDTSGKKTKYFFKEGTGSKAYKESVEKIIAEISGYIFSNEGINISSLKKKEKPKYVAKVEPPKVVSPEVKKSKETPAVPQLKSTLLEKKDEKKEEPEKITKEEPAPKIKEEKIEAKKEEEKVAVIPKKEVTTIEDKQTEKPSKKVKKKGKQKKQPQEEKTEKITPPALTLTKEKAPLPSVDETILSDKKYDKVPLLILPFLISGGEPENLKSKVSIKLVESINAWKPARFVTDEEANDYFLEKLYLSSKRIFKRDAADYVGYGSIVSFSGKITFNFCIVDKNGNYLFKKTEQLNSEKIDESVKNLSDAVIASIKERDEITKVAQVAKTDGIKEVFDKKSDEKADVKEVSYNKDTKKQPEKSAKLPSESVKPKVKEKKKKGDPKAEKFSMKKSSKPLSVKSDTLEAFNKSRTVVFIGNVVAQKDDMTMYSDKLTVYYEEDGKEVKEIIADASAGKRVKVVQVDKIATGERAHFFRKENKVVMTGDPVVTQGENSVRGEKITYFLDDERSLVESGKEKRVNAIIYPKKVESGE